MNKMQLALALLLVLEATQAQSHPVGSLYPYPYRYTPGPPTKSTISLNSPGSATASINVPAVDLRSGRIVGQTITGGFNYVITANVTTDENSHAGDVITATNEISQISYNTENSLQYPTFTNFRCSFEPCIAHFAVANDNLGAGPGATLTRPASDFADYTPGQASVYSATSAEDYKAGTATFKINSSVVNTHGTLNSWNSTSTFTGSVVDNVVPWNTDDAVSGRLNVPPVSHGNIDFTAGTNFGFKPVEAAELSQYDNFNWLVQLTAYCSNVVGQLSCDATHNNNAQAPADIGRTIGQFDGQAGGNQNTNAANPTGADGFDLYLDQTKSSNPARDPFYVLNDKNASGLRFFDQPNLLQAGRVLVFHVDLVGWDQSKDNGNGGWDILSTTFDDPSLSFNWRWIQTGNSPTPQCDPTKGITLNCGFAVSGGLIDPTEDLGVAELLNYGAADPSNYFSDIDPSLFQPGPGTGTGTGGVPEPSAWFIVLSGLFFLGTVLRRGRSELIRAER